MPRETKPPFPIERITNRHESTTTIVIANSAHSYTVTEAQRALIEYVREHAEATYREVAAAVGLAHSTVIRDARTLRTMGVLRATTTGVGRYARTIWSVARDVLTRPVRLDLRALLGSMVQPQLPVELSDRERRDTPETVAAPLDAKRVTWASVGEMLRGLGERA